MTKSNSASLKVGPSHKSIIIFDLCFSALALVFLCWLIYFQKPAQGGEGLMWLPTLNACLNSLSALFLLLGFKAIRSGKISRHKWLMSVAFLSSILFFICYVVYHATHGDTKFLAKGFIRPVYFTLLISHILLSIVSLPLILYTYSMGIAGRIQRHKKTAKLTFAIWLYVSVTGVMIYFFLRVFFKN